MQQLNTLLVTAYAKAPQGTAMYEIYKHAGIVLEIDKQTHKIVDAEFTFITKLAQNFFQRMLIDFDFTTDINVLIERIEEHYIAPSSGAVIVALKSAQKRYLEKLDK
ncbi:DUF3870 domain-containing protein [Psychrobacillus sp. FSL H8-0487]|uniref:DUF3870 domain-containing protein n=1 Tax=Psychrobacillus sp. FSL H8-0487 TaxID=2921391 RepID=UPI0030F5A119